jgi:hypothetical protein
VVVSVFSAVPLIFEGAVINFACAPRLATVGTDDDGPGLRLAAVAVAWRPVAAMVGYLRWTVSTACCATTPQVVGIASSISEASATFTPQNPTASVTADGDDVTENEASRTNSPMWQRI